ncbi:hypothetical protein P5673_031964, partial [Acropora cervicornis]
ISKSVGIPELKAGPIPDGFAEPKTGKLPFSRGGYSSGETIMIWQDQIAVQEGTLHLTSHSWVALALPGLPNLTPPSVQ